MSSFFGAGKDDGEKRRIADLVRGKIQDNKVIVFSKTYCPFCTKAKSALDDLKVPYEAVEIDLMNEGKLIQDSLYDATKQKTVPNIFVGGEHVGGCDDTLAEIGNGTFAERLKEAGVIAA